MKKKPLTFGVEPKDPRKRHPKSSRQAAAEISFETLKKTTVRKLTILGVGGNVLLSAVKLAAGIFGNSLAMISDAIHSLSDVATTAIAFAGTKVAERTADAGHPYGHERFECLASLILGVILAATGLGIGYAGVQTIVSGSWETAPTPTYFALGAAILSIVVKEGMFQYTRYHARIIKSAAFEADAWHHRSDALSSIGALIGIGASMAGYPIADALASIVICGFLLKVAWDVIRKAVDNMMDAPCDEETQQRISQSIMEIPQVIRIDMLRTRVFGNRIYVDAEIALNGDLSLREAHAISHRAHDAVERAIPDVKHIMIHVNPADEAE